MVSTANVLDRYTCKNYSIAGLPENHGLVYKQKIVYRVLDEKTKREFLSVGEYLGHDVDTDKEVSFEKILDWEDLVYFENQDLYAKELYPDFRKTFRKNFAWSIPVAARFQIYTDQVYFYFYAQERYNFADYARDLRHKIWKNLFLYQITARDMIRLSPWYDNIVGANGISLCAKSTRDLPEPTMDDIFIQWLEWRDVERMKNRWGRLDRTFGYETDFYKTEMKNYPTKGSTVSDKAGNVTWTVLSVNVLTWDVKIKTEDREIFVLSHEQLVY